MALIHAIYYGSAQSVLDLIRNGENINQADAYGQTALHIASEMG